MVVQHKVIAKGEAVFGAALLRPRRALRRRDTSRPAALQAVIMVVLDKAKAKGGAIFGAAQAAGDLDGIDLGAETIRAAAERIGKRRIRSRPTLRCELASLTSRPAALHVVIIVVQGKVKANGGPSSAPRRRPERQAEKT